MKFTLHHLPTITSRTLLPSNSTRDHSRLAMLREACWEHGSLLTCAKRGEDGFTCMTRIIHKIHLVRSRHKRHYAEIASTSCPIPVFTHAEATSSYGPSSTAITLFCAHGVPSATGFTLVILQLMYRMKGHLDPGVPLLHRHQRDRHQRLQTSMEILAEIQGVVGQQTAAPDLCIDSDTR